MIELDKMNGTLTPPLGRPPNAQSPRLATLMKRHLVRILASTLALLAILLLLVRLSSPTVDRSAVWAVPFLDHNGQSGHNKPDAAQTKNDAMAECAGNSTLGFDAVNFINFPTRYDRLDAMTLQAYLSGVEFVDHLAVGPDMINDVGMPPIGRLRDLKVGEKGSWRAHANIWSKFLRSNVPATLILESDAAWDVDIRILMQDLNREFRAFLNKTQSKPLNNPRWSAASYGSKKTQTRKPDVDEDDPWMSSHWDILSFGQCYETDQNKDVNHIYNDSFVPPGQDYFGQELGRERVIRVSGGITCTTAYAISQTGAAKLLLRTSIKLDDPLDDIIKHMTAAGDLVAYSVMPPVVAQWQYVDGIGMEQRGANSDVNGARLSSVFGGLLHSGWNHVEKSGSVWTTKPRHKDVAFNEMALQGAWRRIFGEKEA